MPSIERRIDPILMKEAADILEAKFKETIHIHSAEYLSEPDRRNVVVRITMDATSLLVPSSVILKQSLPEKTDADDKDAFARFARDWAGLEFMSTIPHKAHNVPRFYGGSIPNRFILIEDLGQKHVSLVDSLTLPNKDKAIAALERFMKALGSFHAASFGLTEKYNAILQRINTKGETSEENLEFTSGDLLKNLEFSHERFGMTISKALQDEIKQVIALMYNPGPFTVLTHGDICPDNVFDHEDLRELQLIDFEWAFPRNALLDGTYLRMSMPTCWCAKAIPDDLIESLEAIYRKELQQTIPAASDDKSYYHSYTYACAFWMLRTLEFVEKSWDADYIGSSGPVPTGSLWQPNNNLARPRFVSRLRSFVDIAALHDELPHLRKMASTMLAKAEQQWPEAKPLDLYPAFMGKYNG